MAFKFAPWHLKWWGFNSLITLNSPFLNSQSLFPPFQIIYSFLTPEHHVEIQTKQTQNQLSFFKKRAQGNLTFCCQLPSNSIQMTSSIFCDFESDFQSQIQNIGTMR